MYNYAPDIKKQRHHAWSQLFCNVFLIPIDMKKDLYLCFCTADLTLSHLTLENPDNTSDPNLFAMYVWMDVFAISWTIAWPVEAMKIGLEPLKQLYCNLNN